MNKIKRQFGLIGFPLTHSFSKKYFSDKFEREGIEDCHYELFPLKTIDELPSLIKSCPHLVGLNVTIPYKQKVFQYLNEVDEEAEKVGAVNTIKIQNGRLKGYNTDVYGFEKSLIHLLKIDSDHKENSFPKKALILGTGGAAKAVAHVLKKLNIDISFVSRTINKGDLTYSELDHNSLKNHALIINTTPLGTSPNVEFCPDIPYDFLSESHFLYDLVYNPEKSLFLTKGENKNTQTSNGLEMLYLQAEKAWEIWNN